MQVIYYHIDAFTDRIFGGNPAGVCPLTAWLPDETLIRMAAEHRHSETAFLVKKQSANYELRWFTPEVEIDLCGHATLASAHVLWRHGYETGDELTFQTKSGPLTVTQEAENRLALNFPARPAQPSEMPSDVEEALSAQPVSCAKAQAFLFEFKTEEEVRNLKPDFARIKAWDSKVIVTAPGRDVDFVSRYFAPSVGIPEDPVTGSAHCTLIPFWAERLRKSVLHARQVSARGGDSLRNAGRSREDRRHAVTYLKGEIELT